MFEPAFRDRVRDFILNLADSDPRVVSGAVVGSMALGPGDRWSDLDLTFGVDDAFSIYDVLADWSRAMEAEFDAVQLFDMPAGPSIYRVFLLPGGLQFDLSFTPAGQFGARGPTFRLLFGTAVEVPFRTPPPAAEVFGYAVHHALRARFCIERGRVWQAEYWIAETRSLALSLACRRRGLPGNEGRGFDDLPAEVLDRFNGARPDSLDSAELLRALACAIDCLIAEAGEVQELADRIAPRLRDLAAEWPNEEHL